MSLSSSLDYRDLIAKFADNQQLHLLRENSEEKIRSQICCQLIALAINCCVRSQVDRCIIDRVNYLQIVRFKFHIPAS